MYSFILYSSINSIVITNRDSSYLIKKYGRGEVLTTVKDLDSIDLWKDRLSRSYSSCVFVSNIKTPRVVSEETRRKMSLSHLGKKMPDEVNKKISETMKGKSNFAGKKHSTQSKEKIGNAQKGNTNVRGTNWCFDPRSVKGKEKRVENISDIPPGFSKGRDYYSIEGLKTRSFKG